MGFAEFVLHLTRMNPDMIYLHQDCGYINISYFKFDIDDQSGKGNRWKLSTMGNKELVNHIVRQLSEDSRLWNFMLKKKKEKKEKM